MSLTTGYQDMLIQVRRDDALVDALSPAGFRWLQQRYGTTITRRIPNTSQFVGSLVSDMVAARLTIAVRSETLQTVIDEAGNAFSAEEIEIRPDAPGREAVPEMPTHRTDNEDAARTSSSIGAGCASTPARIR